MSRAPFANEPACSSGSMWFQSNGHKSFVVEATSGSTATIGQF